MLKLQTIFRLKGLGVTGVKNMITGSAKQSARPLGLKKLVFSDRLRCQNCKKLKTSQYELYDYEVFFTTIKFMSGRWEVCPGLGQCLGLADHCSRRLMDVYIAVCPVYGMAGQGVKPARLV